MAWNCRDDTIRRHSHATFSGVQSAELIADFEERTERTKGARRQKDRELLDSARQPCQPFTMASLAIRFAVTFLVCESAFAADSITSPMSNSFATYTLSAATPTDPALQRALENIDVRLREKYGMTTNQTAVGLLDLQRLRLAWLRSDRGEYAASVAKIGILFAYFQVHPEAATNLDDTTRHELGQMVKNSNNA